MSSPGEPDPRDAGPPDPGPEETRRTNGLPGRDWTAVADLAAGAGEPVLAALADDGVPAYLAPGAEEPGAERLWVAGEHAARAAALLTQRFPTSTRPLPPARPGSPASARAAAPDAARSGAALPPGLDEDAAWAAIVAGWDSRGDAPVAPWPVAEDLPEPPTGPGSGGPGVGGPGVGGSAPPRPGAMPPPLRRAGDQAAGGRRVVRPAGAGEGRDRPGAEPYGAADRPGAGAAGPPPRGPRDHVAPDDPADEHYSPPPPPPLPRLRRATLGSLGAVALGILLLFAPGVVGLRGGDGLAVVAIALVVGGVVALVLGMRDGGSDPDGGAVV